MMKKEKITGVIIVGVCFVGFIICSSSLIQVATATQDYVLRIVHTIETGTVVLFYIFFIRGINPDCIDLIPDDNKIGGKHNTSETPPPTLPK